MVINTQRGLFRYNRLPFGVPSAPGIFQRAMESLLQGIPNIAIYLDDILISGTSRLQDAGLKLKRDKCLFMRSSVVYLGYLIDADGLHPMPDKVKAILEAPEPTNVTELKSYLGLLNYYGKFLQNVSSILHPLYSLLQKSATWEWSQGQREAFRASKKLMTSSQMLVHLDPEKELILSCDASQYGIGAVLAHRMADGTEKPIGFVSRTLTAAEKNYSQIEREGLACVFGVKRFHSYLYGHKFVLATDHKPLLTLFNEKRTVPPQASGRIQRWALTLSMYEYSLIFKRTADHGNADAMSRLPLRDTAPEVPEPAEIVLLMEKLEASPVTAERIKAWSRTDPVISRILEFVHTGWPSFTDDVNLKPYGKRKAEFSSCDGCLLWGNRVVIPEVGRAEVLQELHDSHPGESRMKRLARMFVWWPGMDQEIENTVKSCWNCQKNRPNQPVVPLIPWQWPTRPWSRVHADFAGPVKNNMYLVVIDSHSKWIDVQVMSSIAAPATIQRLRHIFSQFGLPEQII